MSDNIINLEEHRPLKPMADLTLYLDNTGKPIFSLTWADKDFIEKHDTVSERFIGIKRLVEGAIGWFDEQAEDFKGE